MIKVKQNKFLKMQQQINIMVAQGARAVEAPVLEVVEVSEISVADIIESPQSYSTPEPAKKKVPEWFGKPATQDPALVADYIAKFGKKPHHMAKDASIRKKLEE